MQRLIDDQPNSRLPSWRREEISQSAYDEAYNRIEARLIDEEIADGADEDYKPSGARVHELVTKELKQRGGDDA